MAVGRLRNAEIAALYLEDVRAAISARDHFKGNQSSNGNVWSIEWSDGGLSEGKLLYRWHTVVCPLGTRILTLLVASLSLAVVAGQLMTLFNAISSSSSSASMITTNSWHPWVVAAAIAVVLAYAVLVLGWANARVLTGRNNLLVPGGRTTALSLSFHAQTALSLCAWMATELSFAANSDHCHTLQPVR